MAMTMGPNFTAAVENVYGLPPGFMSEGHDGETVGVIACAIMDGRIPPFSPEVWEQMPNGRWLPPLDFGSNVGSKGAE